MKYTLDLLEEKKIIHIVSNGRLNFQLVEQYSKEAVKLARINNYSKFLLNHKEITLRKEMINLHATGDELQQFGFQKSDRVAIIVGNRASVRTFQDFGNINSSWSSIKYFYSENIQDAYDWLLEIE